MMKDVKSASQITSQGSVANGDQVYVDDADTTAVSAAPAKPRESTTETILSPVAPLELWGRKVKSEVMTSNRLHLSFHGDMESWQTRSPVAPLELWGTPRSSVEE